MKQIFILIILIVGMYSCEKDEGRGGKAAIDGKILVKDYNQEGELKDIYYPGEYSVYIIYGDNAFYDDEVKTHFDGSFVFDYLYPGMYTVYAYSKCRTCPGERDTVSRTVIIESDELVELGEIEVLD